MPIYRWRKEHAVLITKAARYVVLVGIPAAAAAVAAAVGYILGRKWRKKGEGGRQ
jgi:hypothetical protein